VDVFPTLDAALLGRWATVAVAALERHRGDIDRINVFPVADRDTGTNLLLTMRAAEAGLRSGGPPAEALARGALLGARGNSGVILSQVLRGLAEAVSAAGGVRDAIVLADALTRGTRLAEKAVTHPREGTVLTVLAAAADGAVAAASDRLDEESLKRIALITNQTGVDAGGVSDIDVLNGAAARSAGVTLVKLFSPEHGIRGTEDRENLESGIDQRSGLAVHSLYTVTAIAPPDSLLRDIDALVFDLQDIGTRTWTYVGSMIYAMRASARRNLPIFVLATGRGIEVAARLGLPVVLGGPVLARPDLGDLLAAYRRDFRSHRNSRPYVTVSIDVLVADTDAEARELALPDVWAMVRSQRTGRWSNTWRTFAAASRRGGYRSDCGRRCPTSTRGWCITFGIGGVEASG